MRSGWLTGMLLGAAVLVAVAVPTLRESFAAKLREFTNPTAYAAFPSLVELEAAAAAHPQDPEMWLGYAEFVWQRLRLAELHQMKDRLPYALPETGTDHLGELLRRDPPREGALHEAYQKAIDLAPDSAAARLRYACFWLDRLGRLSLPDDEGEDRSKPQVLTASEIRSLGLVRELAQECRKLDPENAAPDYLLASTWLAECEYEEAFSVLSRAAGKTRWSCYQDETARAMLRLFEAAGSESPAMMAMGHSSAFHWYSAIRSVSRSLDNLGDEFRESGEHQRAILCYEAIVRAGHLMRTQAYSIIEGMVGIAVTRIAAGSETWAHGSGADKRPRTDPAEGKRKLDERAGRFAAYLREHGRDDLASLYLKDLEAGERWREEAMTVSQRLVLVQNRVLGMWRSGALNAMVVWMATAFTVELAVIVGLISLVAGYWREPSERPSWSYLQWLALLGVLLLPGQVIAVALARDPWLLGGAATTSLEDVFGALALVGLAVWLATTLVVALRKRAALDEEQRVGKARTFLQGLRALMGPTLAALILLSVLGVWPLQRNVQQLEDDTRQVVLQGEVQYYGIGSGTGGSGEKGDT